MVAGSRYPPRTDIIAGSDECRWPRATNGRISRHAARRAGQYGHWLATCKPEWPGYVHVAGCGTVVIGNGFNTGTPANLLFTSGQQAQQPSSFAAAAAKSDGRQSNHSHHRPTGNNLKIPIWQSGLTSHRQSRPLGCSSLQRHFPQSRNVVDLRQTPQFYPRQASATTDGPGDSRRAAGQSDLATTQPRPHACGTPVDNEIWHDA